MPTTNLTKFIDRVAALNYTWYITHPLRCIRTRGASNLDPISALHRAVTNTVSPNPLSTFIQKGEMLGLTREECLQLVMASDNQLLEGVVGTRQEVYCLREYLINKLINR